MKKYTSLNIVSDGTSHNTFITDQEGRIIDNCVNLSISISHPDNIVRVILELIDTPISLNYKPKEQTMEELAKTIQLRLPV